MGGNKSLFVVLGLVILIVTAVLVIPFKEQSYVKVIFDGKEINDNFLHTLEPAEIAILKWSLFAYGNECSTTKSKWKLEV